MKMLSVTQVLSPFFDASKIRPEVLAAASQRGTEVHQACAAYARSLPVFLSDSAAPYFDSFRNWFDKYVKRALFVEAEFSDPHIYGIVGHVDLSGGTDGRSDRGGGLQNAGCGVDDLAGATGRVLLPRQADCRRWRRAWPCSFHRTATRRGRFTTSSRRVILRRF